MKQGFSGAVIKITREGHVAKTGKECREQGILCGMLAPVTPRIISVGSDGYTMERLEELAVVSDETIRRMFIEAHGMLRNLWDRQARAPADWKQALGMRLSTFFGAGNHGFFNGLISELYEEEYSEATHGDPTLSNMLLRDDDGDLVITDPIFSGIVAAHRAVDQGKMLQSAIGWETITHGWQYDKRAAVRTIMAMSSAYEHPHIWFWCMVHCMRLVPYAMRANHAAAHAWGIENAWAIFKVFKEHGPRINKELMCSTLSI